MRRDRVFWRAYFGILLGVTLGLWIWIILTTSSESRERRSCSLLHRLRAGLVAREQGIALGIADRRRAARVGFLLTRKC